jgi:hypothetical protein
MLRSLKASAAVITGCFSIAFIKPLRILDMDYLHG